LPIIANRSLPNGIGPFVNSFAHVLFVVELAAELVDLRFGATLGFGFVEYLLMRG